MAHKKGQGSSRNGRDSNAQRRGIKVYGGSKVWPGCIIVRQCGTKFRAGPGTALGRDWTLYATRPGVVRFISQRRVTVEEVAVAETTAQG